MTPRTVPGRRPRTALRVASLACALSLAGAPASAERSGGPSSAGALPCNALCRWWMSLGVGPPPAPTSPAAEHAGPPITPSSVRRSAALAVPHVGPDRIRAARRPPPALPRGWEAPVAELRPAAMPGSIASGWNMPIPGSVSIRPASWEAAY